jgi:hypothetical protein
MIWKRYQNELIVFAAFLLMFSAYVYKAGHISSQKEYLLGTKRTIEEIKEVVALQKIWSDAKITDYVSKLQTLIPASKVNWISKNKKVTATYKALNAGELNTLVTKILTLPVEITKLEIENKSSAYDVEFQCKW